MPPSSVPVGFQAAGHPQAAPPTSAAAGSANGYQPATYRERGIAAPFTSPKLAGARVRTARDIASLSPEARASGQCLEALVPNWVDRRGIYVALWPSVRELFRPSLHDARLGLALIDFAREGAALSPADARRIAREVGRAGYAGRAHAAACAEAIAQAARAERESARLLLHALARQFGLASADDDGLAAPLARRLARRLDWPEPAFSTMTRAIAARLGEAGIGPDGFLAPLPRLVAQLRELIRHAAPLVAAEREAGAAAWTCLDQNARLIAGVADKAIAIVRARFAALPELFAAARADGAATLDELQRPAWILDGWDAIARHWRLAALAADTAAGAEIAALVPPLPDELDRWMQFPAGAAARATKTSRPGRAPESDAPTLDRIARAEHILALAA